MEEAASVKEAIEEILTSYQTRIEDISSVFDTTHLIPTDFQESFIDTREEREKINTQLRDILAKNEHLRKKDFNNMMEGILSVQERREKEIRNLLKNYVNEQKAIAHALREGLNKFKGALVKGEAERVKEFQHMIKKILAEQNQRKQEVTSKLKQFQKDQHEMMTKLKTLLAKGRELRIRDLKSMLSEFKAQRRERVASKEERRKEVYHILYDFRNKRIPACCEAGRQTCKAINPASISGGE